MLGTYSFTGEIGCKRWLCYEGRIKMPIPDSIAEFVIGFLAEQEPDIRVRPAPTKQQFPKGVADRRDMDPKLNATLFTDVARSSYFGECFQIGKCLARVYDYLPPARRETDARMLAFKYGRAKLFFEAENLPTQRRCMEIELACSSREASSLGNCENVFETRYVHHQKMRCWNSCIALIAKLVADADA
jgi:hypothetical protein